jgi:hypothetical protein
MEVLMRLTRLEKSLVVLSAFVCFLFLPTHAFAQYVVDCSGNTPGAFTTINSVIPLLTNGAVVRITGTCTENVTITGLDNLWIGAPWGQTMNLQGNLTINGVQNLFLYGMNVTNPSGDGIDISSSPGVELDDCTSSNNSGYGLLVSSSIVSIQNTGAFNNNGNDGIYGWRSTDLLFIGSAGPISISNNLGDGIYFEDGVMVAWGNLAISNNKPNPNNSSFAGTGTGFGSNGAGFGINFWGHARAVIAGIWAPNVISGNQAGGVAIHEGSEISICCALALPAGVWQGNIIDGNGPVGVFVGLGSQATFDGGVQITNHPDAGVDVYGLGQAFIEGNNQITKNGTGSSSTYPTHAGVRVDGNSEAYIRGGQISQNGGPGILALVNSSIDISGTTLTSNLGGPVVCDSSAWMASDMPVPSTPLGPALPCKVPNTFGPRIHPFPAPPIPDTSRIKAEEAKYQQLISSF